MPTVLHIYDRRERALVRAADLALAPLGWWPAGRGTESQVRRVLLMRLERIGDLLMVLDAIGDARRVWPDAEVDLAIGEWNVPIARLIPGIAHLHVVNAPWLARGDRADGWAKLVATFRGWRGRYDMVVNFEPDIRSNALAWLTRAPRRIGYGSGGGRAFLTDASAYEPVQHVSDNARRLVARAADSHTPAEDDAPWPRLALTPDARRQALAILGTATHPLIGIHASGGRESKQWHLDRFAESALAVARARHGTIVLTGSAADRPLIDLVKQRLTGVPVIDAGGRLDLVGLAALVAELDVFITGDTGPMHLAAAMGTPIVALFGPSNPQRYGPLARSQRVLRVDLPCSPCGQVRLPPARCRGHVPECLDRIDVRDVVASALELLDAAPRAAEIARA